MTVRTGDQVARERLAALVGELKQERYRRGDLPQEVLAARLGVVTVSVADWEAGRDHPSSPHLVLWCRALDRRLMVTDRMGVRVRLDSGWRPKHGGSAHPYEWRELYRLCAALRAVRMSRGLYQEDVAGPLGVNRRSVTRWECAEGYPRPLGLVRWAGLLGCEVRLISAQRRQRLSRGAEPR